MYLISRYLLYWQKITVNKRNYYYLKIIGWVHFYKKVLKFLKTHSNSGLEFARKRYFFPLVPSIKTQSTVWWLFGSAGILAWIPAPIYKNIYLSLYRKFIYSAEKYSYNECIRQITLTKTNVFYFNSDNLHFIE